MATNSSFSRTTDRDTPEYLTTAEAAKLLRVSTAFLERERYERPNECIPFVRIGRRCVRYLREDLDRYLAANRHGAALLS